MPAVVVELHPLYLRLAGLVVVGDRHSYPEELPHSLALLVQEVAVAVAVIQVGSAMVSQVVLG